MSSIEINAINVIKRAMRFNRDRHFTTMAKLGRANVSRDMIIAHQCVYSFTDDKTNCAATMGCHMEVLCTIEASKCRAWVTEDDNVKDSLTRLADMIKNYPSNYTFKKIMRLIHSDMTLNELRIAFGWLNKEGSERKYHYPSKYAPMLDRL